MADCQMCGASHPGGGEVCPEQRTGQLICGKYAIGELLGVGGIAAVYAAEHTVLRRAIALKVLHRRFASDAELAARFVREARETAAIGHPAFVRVYDAGTTDDGCAFIEMDRLAGRELYGIRKALGMLHVERVIRIGIELLDALAALHGRGVIHRDLKSANVYLVPDDAGGEQLKLLDLGFAKVEDELQLTQRDHLLGTPFYISPEQLTDPTAVDARADLFSVGVILFEIATASWPYVFENKRDLLHRVMKGDLERHPANRRPELPGWFDEIVARALAFRREDRFESAAAMKHALEQGADRPPGSTEGGFFKRLFGR